MNMVNEPGRIKLVVAVLMVLSACSRWLYPEIDTDQASTMKVGDPGLNNYQYAERLKDDGWPVNKLNTALDADFLDDDEKNIILAHNLVRYDPEKFANLYVTEYLSYFKGREFHYPNMRIIMLTREGTYPAEELYYELIRTRPMDVLYPSEGLSVSALSHLKYLIRLGVRGHGGQGGLRARVERVGHWENRLAENISYGNFSAHDAVLYMLIDDLVHDRKHRRIILDPELNYVGVAKGYHENFPTGFTYVMNYANFFIAP